MEAFKLLKDVFCHISTLAYPNPELPFIIEVDASTSGVGEVYYHSGREIHPNLCLLLQETVPGRAELRHW